MKKFAVIISGNGVYDGAEIHETVMTMLAIKKPVQIISCLPPI
jgi:enhancing lycopene biosynthesis protein 2